MSDDEPPQTVFCSRNCYAYYPDERCGEGCDCDCHEAYEMCGLCHGRGRIDGDPLNDHTFEPMECPRCGGLGYHVKPGYVVETPHGEVRPPEALVG